MVKYFKYFLRIVTMNEIRIIKCAFNFLLQKGFSPSFYKSNIEYCVTYSSSKMNFILTYDLRLHQFDVGISYKNNNSYIPLFEVEISNEICKQETLDKIKSVYLDAQKDWTITKKHFCTIIELYANFVNRNIDDILSMK